MSTIVSYQNCPCCNSEMLQSHLTCTDYTVSNEKFDIVVCKNCTAAFTQNVPNQTNIGKYYQSTNYISHSDTSEGIVSKIYHRVRNLTLKSKLSIVKKYTHLQRGSVLDIGAGTGAFSHTMKMASWEVTALEPDEIARSNAKNKYGLVLQSPEVLFNLPENNFDAITLWHVLEHIHTLQAYFTQFYKVLNKQGKLFIAVPNYTSYDAQYYQQHWAGYDVPRHLYHFSPKSIEMLAQKNGFKVKAIQPMWFDSTYVALLSEKYKTGKNNFFKALVIGLLSNVKTIFNKKNCSSIIYILEKKSNT
jgi:2-polyprenyl-3-methyl-5-hydroxy-6-metoxy-1,4-benzoquinol methylase